MGTRENRLIEAVLTCTHNQCFEQRQENHHNFSSANYLFYSREKLQYITWACFRNVKAKGEDSTEFDIKQASERTTIEVTPCIDQCLTTRQGLKMY